MESQRLRPPRPSCGAEPGLPSESFRPTLWNMWTTSRVRLQLRRRRPKLSIELIEVNSPLILLPAGLREADSV
jgi:hypothetical protein